MCKTHKHYPPLTLSYLAEFVKIHFDQKIIQEKEHLVNLVHAQILANGEQCCSAEWCIISDKTKIPVFHLFIIISDWKNMAVQCQLSLLTLMFYPKLLF